MALLVPSIDPGECGSYGKCKISLPAESWLFRAEVDCAGAELAVLITHRPTPQTGSGWAPTAYLQVGVDWTGAGGWRSRCLFLEHLLRD